jgi:hypothetical protein
MSLSSPQAARPIAATANAAVSHRAAAIGPAAMLASTASMVLSILAVLGVFLLGCGLRRRLREPPQAACHGHDQLADRQAGRVAAATA